MTSIAHIDFKFFKYIFNIKVCIVSSGVHILNMLRIYMQILWQVLSV